MPSEIHDQHSGPSSPFGTVVAPELWFWTASIELSPDATGNVIVEGASAIPLNIPLTVTVACPPVQALQYEFAPA